MRIRPSPIFSEKGFTIIELAIVLVIVGILISLGISMIGPLAKRAKVNETQGTIDADVESLVSFAATNRRLPHPLLPPLPARPEFAGVFTKENDAWGNPLQYIVDNNLLAIPSGAVDAVCGRKATFLTVRRCTNAACSAFTDVQNVAFLVLSRGANFNNQSAITQAVLAAATINVYDAGLVVDNYTGDVGGVRAEPFDDIVKWVTLDELRTKTGCAGQQLKILNNELPAGSTASQYTNVSIVPDGGVGTPYRWCVNGTLPPGLGICSGGSSVYNGSNCLTGVPEASWVLGNNIAFMNTACSANGTPTTPGSYNVTVFVRDNNDSVGTNDNIAQKSFVITVNP